MLGVKVAWCQSCWLPSETCTPSAQAPCTLRQLPRGDHRLFSPLNRVILVVSRGSSLWLSLHIKGALSERFLRIGAKYLLFSLYGFLRTIYRAYIGISHDGVRWARGTSNYPLIVTFLGQFGSSTWAPPKKNIPSYLEDHPRTNVSS